jgi:hypothetical protein
MLTNIFASMNIYIYVCICIIYICVYIYIQVFPLHEYSHYMSPFYSYCETYIGEYNWEIYIIGQYNIWDIVFSNFIFIAMFVVGIYHGTTYLITAIQRYYNDYGK